MKIHRWIISLVFCCCVTFLSAQIRGTEITVVVSPDHTDWKYQLKEECSFTIQVYKAQNLLPGVVIDYELGPEWYPVEKKKGVLLKDIIGTWKVTANDWTNSEEESNRNDHVGQTLSVRRCSRWTDFGTVRETSSCRLRADLLYRLEFRKMYWSNDRPGVLRE